VYVLTSGLRYAFYAKGRLSIVILKKLVIKPADYPASEHFRCWRDCLGEISDARALGTGDWRLLDAFEAYRMVDASITIGHVAPFEYLRGPHAKRAQPAVVITIALEGELSLQYNQQGTCYVNENQLVLGSFNTECRAIAVNDVNYCSIYLHAPVLLAASALNDATPAIEVPISGGVKAAVFSLVGQLQSVLQADDHIAAAALLKAIEVMIDHLARPAYFATGQIDDNRMLAVQSFVDEHVRDPNLGVELLCERFHMSRATLYRQMQHVGGVKRYLLTRRLVRCFDELRKAPARSEGFKRALVKAYHFKSYQDFAERYRNVFSVDPDAMLVGDTDGAELLRIGGEGGDVINWSKAPSVPL
jgi:AraC-like DNA-binding protein